MGLELRRVPAGWQHPTKDDYRLSDSGIAYQPPRGKAFEPLLDQDWHEATIEWWRDRIWHALRKAIVYWPMVFGWMEVRTWWLSEDDDEPPDFYSYRPRWREKDRTHVQLYETVSEGRPVSPVFATTEELARWCAAQEREVWVNTKMDLAGWRRFFGRGGWAPSMVMTAGRGLESGAEFMGREDGAR